MHSVNPLAELRQRKSIAATLVDPNQRKSIAVDLNLPALANTSKKDENQKKAPHLAKSKSNTRNPIQLYDFDRIPHGIAYLFRHVGNFIILAG